MSRRSVLGALGASYTASLSSTVSTIFAPRSVGASDLSLTDRLDLVYSNQFHFNERGQPEIAVGLMDDQREVRISAPGGVRILLSGNGGTSFVGGPRWLLRLREGTAAQQRWSVVLESVPGDDPRRLDQAVERWRKRDFKADTSEVGALFGVRGRVLDTRRVLLTTGNFTSEAEAARDARIVEQRHGGSGRLHPVVKKRSHGTLQAIDLERGGEITAEGVLWLTAIHDEPITVSKVPRDESNGAETEDRSYRGQIYVAIGRHGKLAVVNLVGETDLLSGLVPAEIYASAPTEALKAQALAARGQLVAKIGARHLDDPYLLCSHQHCQVYAGSNREHPRTNAAVAGTAGRVLMRPNRTQLVDTVYSANSGGHTENNEEVWPSRADPQLRGRPDPLVAHRFPQGIDERTLHGWLTEPPRTYSQPLTESARASYRWSETLDPTKLPGNPGIPASLGTVTSIEVVARGCSGRATRVRIVGKHGAMDISGELNIRRALGGLRSSMFLVTAQPGRFTLVGGGHGHGVGMCQHGAMGMAAAGHDYAAILRHYYPGSTATKLW